jgi:hypothetical protein
LKSKDALVESDSLIMLTDLTLHAAPGTTSSFLQDQKRVVIIRNTKKVIGCSNERIIRKNEVLVMLRN